MFTKADTYVRFYVIFLGLFGWFLITYHTQPSLFG